MSTPDQPKTDANPPQRTPPKDVAEDEEPEDAPES